MSRVIVVFFVLKLFAAIVLLVFSYKLYQKFSSWNFKPLLYHAISLFLLAIGALFNIVGSLSPPSKRQNALIFVVISEVFYYLGIYLIIWAFLVLRIQELGTDKDERSNSVLKLVRLYFYAMIYGACIFLVILGHFNIYRESGLWLRSTNSMVLRVLEWLSNIPFFEIIWITLTHFHRKNIPAKQKMIFKCIYLVGALLLGMSLISFVFSENMVFWFLNDISFLFALFWFHAIILNNPLFLSVDYGKLVSVTIIRKEKEFEVEKKYDFNREGLNVQINSNNKDINEDEIPSILHSIVLLINEINKMDMYEKVQKDVVIQQILYDSYFITIGFFENFAGLLIAKTPNRVHKIAMEKVLKDYVDIWKNQKDVDDDLWLNILKNALSFEREDKITIEKRTREDKRR